MTPGDDLARVRERLEAMLAEPAWKTFYAQEAEIRLFLDTFDRLERAEKALEQRDAHIAEQIQHVEQRIKDGTEMGATIWRLALEDVAQENRQALKGDPRHG